MAVYVMLVSELMKNKRFDSEHYKSPKAECYPSYPTCKPAAVEFNKRYSKIYINNKNIR